MTSGIFMLVGAAAMGEALAKWRPISQLGDSVRAGLACAGVTVMVAGFVLLLAGWR